MIALQSVVSAGRGDDANEPAPNVDYTRTEPRVVPILPHKGGITT